MTLAFEHPVERTCNITQNTALLITLLNSECSYAEFNQLKTEEELIKNAKKPAIVVHGYTEESFKEEMEKNMEHFR